MITKVELKNFKSFSDVTFDFHGKKNNFKNFAAVYGENGSGKSNFASVFDFFNKSLAGLSIENFLNSIRLDTLNSNIDEKNREMMIKQLIDKVVSPISFYKDTCMIDSKESTSIKIWFIAGGIEGYYYLEYKDVIVREELYYLRGSIKGELFSITKEDNTINTRFYSDLVSENSYRKNLMDLIQRLWGRYSFMAILVNEIQTNNLIYMEDKLNKNLLTVIEALNNISVFINGKNSNESTLCISNSKTKCTSIESIIVDDNDINAKKTIKVYENLVNGFYKQLYADIINLHYEKDYSNPDVNRYVLYVDKIIAGKKRSIPFSSESAGTQKLLQILNSIFDAINGKTVIFDEMDSNIHDLIMKYVIKDLDNVMKGQLIITTHNTTLMEALTPDKIYLILVDYEGYKKVVCAEDYKIQKNNNIRKMYLGGSLGGVPTLEDIDYDFAKNRGLNDKYN